MAWINIKMTRPASAMVVKAAGSHVGNCEIPVLNFKLEKHKRLISVCVKISKGERK